MKLPPVEADLRLPILVLIERYHVTRKAVQAARAGKGLVIGRGGPKRPYLGVIAGSRGEVRVSAVRYELRQLVTPGRVARVAEKLGITQEQVRAAAACPSCGVLPKERHGAGCRRSG